MPNDKTVTTKFSDMLRLWRAIKHVSQGEIAKDIGISMSELSNIENGKRIGLVPAAKVMTWLGGVQ